MTVTRYAPHIFVKENCANLLITRKPTIIQSRPHHNSHTRWAPISYLGHEIPHEPENFLRILAIDDETPVDAPRRERGFATIQKEKENYNLSEECKNYDGNFK